LGFAGVAQAEDIFTNQFEQLIATRIQTLTLVDPHPFNVLPFIGCADATPFLNSFIQDSFVNDEDTDGYIDDSIITEFYTDQPDYLTSKDLSAALWDADCPIPLHSDNCQPASGTTSESLNTTFNQVNTCLSAIPGTESSGNYNPPVNTISAPCYASEPKDIIFYLLGGAEFPLAGYQQADQYNGGLTTDAGLVMGFISQADASLINFTVMLNGDDYIFNLAESLPGHPANCLTLSSGLDDRDTGPDGVTQGWWLYFNSVSELVEFSPQIP
jgi:hypothetical protein